MATTTYAQLEDAIARLPGVTHVSVGSVNGSGKGRMRIRLAPDADPDAVSRTVAAMLEADFGIRIPPEAIRPVVADAPRIPERATEPSPPVAPPQATPQPQTQTEAQTQAQTQAPAAPAVPAAVAAATPPVTPTGRTERPGDRTFAEELADVDRDLLEVLRAIDQSGEDVDIELPATDAPSRPLITDLTVAGEGLDVTVTVSLAVDGQAVVGSATCPATLPATLRATCRAAIDALGGLLGDEARIELESVSEERLDGGPSIVVVVTWLTRRSSDRLIGVSFVRDDAAHAALRATLDAVNRRVARLQNG